ncbi:MAG TPA: hypothetical protein VI520_00855 [Anaerolineales bacterium]|nr:hypothetical protein [Anaerolineales bacterium]
MSPPLDPGPLGHPASVPHPSDTEWDLIEAQLRRSPPLGPAVGFSRRWLARLEQHREARRHRQVQLMLGGLLLGALLSLALVGLEALRLLGSPAGLAASWIRAGLSARGTLEGSYLFLREIGGGLPAVFGGLAVALTIGWVSAVWFAALYRYSFANLPNGETK